MRGNVPEFWARLYRLGRAVDRAAQRLEAVRAEAAGPGCARWDMIGKGSGPHASQVERAAEIVEERRAELAAAINAFYREWGRVSAIAPRFSDPVLYCVATYRYMCGDTWDDVAAKLRYSVGYTQKLHKKMISEAAELLDAMEREPTQSAAPAATGTEPPGQ